jgi:hypothetical protein
MKHPSSWIFDVCGEIVATSAFLKFPSGLLNSVEPFTLIDTHSPELGRNLRSVLCSDNITKLGRDHRNDNNLVSDRKRYLGFFGVKSERAFARKVTSYYVDRNLGRFDVTKMLGKLDGSFEGEALDLAIAPKGADLDETVEFLLTEFKQSAMRSAL